MSCAWVPFGGSRERRGGVWGGTEELSWLGRSRLIWCDEKFTQLLKRFCAPFIRDVMARFRAREIKAPEGAAELGLSRRGFYKLYTSYLVAVGRRRADRWSPGTSGGNRRKPWPKLAQAKACLLLKHGCGYSAVASELLRRFGLKTHRATVRRFAVKHGLAPQSFKAKAKPVRRWQTQRVGQLWQYDASPHRWFKGQSFQPTLLHMLDDHSRVILGARLYERETLLAHLEFASLVFQSCGLPLCLYVDYHSFFFTHTPEAHTQFAAALSFYGVSLRFAPTPQAKGKIERGHQFWQRRLPSLFAAEDITEIDQANPLLEQLRYASTTTRWKNTERSALRLSRPGTWPNKKTAGPYVPHHAARGGPTFLLNEPASRSAATARSPSAHNGSPLMSLPEPK